MGSTLSAPGARPASCCSSSARSCCSPARSPSTRASRSRPRGLRGPRRRGSRRRRRAHGRRARDRRLPGRPRLGRPRGGAAAARVGRRHADPDRAVPARVPRARRSRPTGSSSCARRRTRCSTSATPPRSSDFGLRSVSPKLAKELPDDLEARPADAAPTRVRRAPRWPSRTTSACSASCCRCCALAVRWPARRAWPPTAASAVLRAGVAVGAVGRDLLVGPALILRARTLAGVYGRGRGHRRGGPRRGRRAARRLPRRPLSPGRCCSRCSALAVGGRGRGARPGGRRGARAQRLPAAGAARRAPAGRAPCAASRRSCWASSSVLDPTLALQIAAVVGGARSSSSSAPSELLLLLGAPGADAGRGASARAAGRSSAPGGRGVLVRRGARRRSSSWSRAARRSRASPAGRPASGKCNGSFALCELRLNEAVFAGTHNSFSAADSPGWFIANQRHDIPRQLADGIRLFLHRSRTGASRTHDGRVRTDFAAEKRDRNRVAKSLPPEVLAAAERLAGRLGAGDATGERECLALPHRLRARRHQDGRLAGGGQGVPRGEPRRGRDPVHRALRGARRTSRRSSRSRGSIATS